MPATWYLVGDVLCLEIKYGGLEVLEAKRLKALQDENRKLKKLLAEQVLDNATRKEILTKNF